MSRGERERRGVCRIHATRRKRSWPGISTPRKCLEFVRQYTSYIHKNHEDEDQTIVETINPLQNQREKEEVF